MTTPINTYMMLIMPNDYMRVWKEKVGDSIKPKKKPAVLWQMYKSEMPSLKFAEIRKSSGRVGESRYRYIEEIGFITLMEAYTSQKRWYKAMVSYTNVGVKDFGHPQVEFLYFFIDPWSLQKLAAIAESKK